VRIRADNGSALQEGGIQSCSIVPLVKEGIGKMIVKYGPDQIVSQFSPAAMPENDCVFVG
jgi:hypothetical protein